MEGLVQSYLAESVNSSLAVTNGENRWEVTTKEGTKGLPLGRSFRQFGIDKKARTIYYTYRGIGI